jgi:glycolate oxidase iron-sulfur subunit
VHWATIAVLTRLGYRVRVPRGQVCCGALHAHAGRARTAHELAVANLEPFDRYEGPIVVNAAGCGAKLKEYGDVLGEAGRPFAARVRDVHEVLDPADVRRAVRGAPPLQRVAVHDPCHLAFAQGVRSQVRDLLAAAGYETVELGDAGRCCGAAGTYAVHHPEWAVPLRDEKVAACRDANADAVAVANPGCAFWMGAADGSPPMYHPIQLVAMAFASTEPSRGRS